MKKSPNVPGIHEMYTAYISLVPDDDFRKTLYDSHKETVEYFQSLDESQWMFRYEEAKWTPKEILLHIIDAERVFCYRALRFARGDKTSLPGFDQDTYVDHSHANERSPQSLIDEYHHVRESTLDLFKHMKDEDLDRTGTASNSPFTVLSVGFIVAGHELHHMKILRERYFPAKV